MFFSTNFKKYQEGKNINFEVDQDPKKILMGR